MRTMISTICEGLVACTAWTSFRRPAADNCLDKGVHSIWGLFEGR